MSSNDNNIQEVGIDRDVVDSADNEKHHSDTIKTAEDVTAIEEAVKEGHAITPEMRKKIAQHYGRKVEEDLLAPSADVTAILERVIAMSDEEAVDILVNAMEFHKVRLQMLPDRASSWV